MDRETDIIDFARRWRHWGGGSESDIFVEFGLTSREYFQRLEALVNRGALANQPVEIRREIRDICRARLASAHRRTTMIDGACARDHAG